MPAHQARHHGVVRRHRRGVTSRNGLAQARCCGTALRDETRHGVSVEPPRVNQGVVQEDLVVALTQDPRLARGREAPAVLQLHLHLVHEVPWFPVVRGHAHGGGVRRHVGPAVVGREKCSPLTSAHLFIKRIEEALQFQVQPEVHVHGFLGMGTHAVADVIGGAEAQGEQVRDVVLTQFSAVDGGECEVDNEGVAPGRAFEQIVPAILFPQGLKVIGERGAQLASEGAFVRVVVRQALAVHRLVPQAIPSVAHQRFRTSRSVEVHDPQRQRVGVISTGHEVPEVLAVKPKRPVRTVACGKNGTPILHACAIDLGLATRRHFQFVSQGRGKHAVGGHLA